MCVPTQGKFQFTTDQIPPAQGAPFTIYLTNQAEAHPIPCPQSFILFSLSHRITSRPLLHPLFSVIGYRVSPTPPAVGFLIRSVQFIQVALCCSENSRVVAHKPKDKSQICANFSFYLALPLWLFGSSVWVPNSIHRQANLQSLPSLLHPHYRHHYF